jgi:ceramide glucosyltransferase
VIWILIALALVAAAYQVVASAAALKHRLARSRWPAPTLPVSILKPVRGLDPHFYDAIRSHALQQYPVGFEILFGVSDSADPAIPAIERLVSAFPHIPIRLVHSMRQTPNGKAGVLADLAAQAHHPLFVVSDSDIHVTPDYLARVVAPLANPRVGLVTCLYRASATSLPGLWEALGIATDFAPSVLVARWLGVREFGLGSTLAFRAADLARSGGFEAVADYLADDYQIARRVTALGLRGLISEVVVDTEPGDDTWRGVWKHQVRWARTIRVSRRGGYLGLPVTHAGVWSVLAAVAGLGWLACLLLATRILMGLAVGVVVLRSGVVARLFLLTPLWDLWAFCVWLTGLFGRTVEWRGIRLHLSRDGKINK